VAAQFWPYVSNVLAALAQRSDRHHTTGFAIVLRPIPLGSLVIGLGPLPAVKRKPNAECFLARSAFCSADLLGNLRRLGLLPRHCFKLAEIA